MIAPGDARVGGGGLRRSAMAGLAGIALAIAGCSGDAASQGSGAVATSNQTLATVFANSDRFRTTAGALNETGLAGAFDGPGTYTLLAPDDAAFAALGAPGQQLMAPDQRAVLVALLRNHVIPGQLDLASVREAIEQQHGAVEMRTLGGGTVSFALEGESLVVSGHGNRATIDPGGQVIASNGTLIPIDAVLAQPPAAQ
ncbi:fasciclin domain-containing protein [Leptolyngbya sp. 15MV]|nr:fasciclin domain-containing protein [Leptolyngbya sp. 15MV]